MSQLLCWSSKNHRAGRVCLTESLKYNSASFINKTKYPLGGRRLCMNAIRRYQMILVSLHLDNSTLRFTPIPPGVYSLSSTFLFIYFSSSLLCDLESLFSLPLYLTLPYSILYNWLLYVLCSYSTCVSLALSIPLFFTLPCNIGNMWWVN